MKRRSLLLVVLTVVALLVASGCIEDDVPERGDAGTEDVLDVTDATPDPDADDGSSELDADDAEEVDDGGDVALDSSDGDAMPDDVGDTFDAGDTGDADATPVRSCGSIPEPSEGLCTTQTGADDLVALRGDVLGEDRVYDNGTVVIDRSGDTGEIVCSGCDCQETIGERDPTVVSCPEGVVSPGLINPHDHLGWATNGPWEGGETRYDHRHEWRTGARDKPEISSPGGDFSRTSILHGELRHLLGGATSIAGSTSGPAARGLLRNLDNSGATGGIDVTVDYSTFPLGDVAGTLLDGSCNYNGRSSNGLDPYSVLRNDIYLPHVAEGIDKTARNEFHCLSTFGDESRDLTEQNTSIVHGIGMTALDIRELAAEEGQLVWSPRTNIALYGQTAPIGVYRTYDIPVALGTDWSISGSRNMLSELSCADEYDRDFRGDRLSDRQLWKMATINGAVALGVEDRLGRLADGYLADVAIFDGRDHGRWSGVVKASDEDLRLVVRGGEPLYGDADLVDTMTPDAAEGCSTIDVCGDTRRACVARDTADHETPVDFATLREAGADDAYPLFACESDDVREPTCTPRRPGEYDGSVDESDTDGDGVADTTDTCPGVFNPGRPISGGNQPDADGDGLGDACDPCPTRAGDQCDVDDWDNDGVDNENDNCPFTRNRGQGDGDKDGVGDACDRSTTPYDVSNGAHAVGEEIALERVVVTAVDDDPRFPGIFVQMPPDDPRFRGRENGGVYVYLGGDPVPERGDLIDLRGRVDEYQGLTQVAGVSRLEVVDTDHALPEPVVVDPCAIRTGASRAEALRGSLVRIEDVSVTDANPDGPNDDFGEFTVGDCGSNTEDLRVDDLLHAVQPDPEQGDAFRSITGPLHYAFNNAKLLPRDEDDVVFGPAPVQAIEPARAYLRNGTTAVPTPTFEIVLERPAEMSRTVQLDYGSSGLVGGPSTVSFPPDSERLVVTMDGLQASADKSDVATVTASTSNSQASGEILVYDDNLPRAVTSLDTVAPLVRPGQSIDVTASLDIPAPTGGSTIALSTDSDMTLPSNDPTVAADDLEVTFQVEAGSNIGKKTVTATLGSSSVSTTINVQSGPTGACLIVSEYIEGSGYNNKAIELFNCSSRQLDLGNFGVCTAFNNNTSCGEHTGLNDGVTLDPGDVYTLCRKTSGTSGDPVSGIAQNCDQPDSDVINFNGNDRILVFEDENDDGTYQDAQDAIVDMFGDVETPPSGSPWKDVTYRRCRLEPYVGADPFDVANYYTEHPENDASHFGTAPSTNSCP